MAAPGSWEEANKGLMDYWKSQNITLYHFSAKADCFPDVIQAFHILLDKYFGDYKVINPTIKGSCLGDVEFDFYTCTSKKDLKSIWEKEDIDFKIICSLKQLDD
jgi:hypothetical protein